MLKQGLLSAASLATAVALAVSPANAQKSKDTLRIGFQDPISTVDITYDPKPETGLMANMVFDTLLQFDKDSKSIKPLLAASWTRENPTSLVFKLKQGIKYHDGSDFDADDVVYTFNWASDPKVRLRFKRNWAWVAKAEKIDKYTVRIRTKRPFAWDLVRLATNTPIYPSNVHGSFKVKSDFGRKNPIGTGPYKVVSISSIKGVVLIRNEDFKHGGKWKPAGSIKHVQALPIPDMQTRIAQLTVGGLDITHNVQKDIADSFQNHPKLKITSSQGLLIHYLAMDAIDRSKTGIMKHQKVRQAVIRALDRKALAKNVIAGGDDAREIQSLCFRFQGGCDFSVNPPSFDRAAAKKLLIEAGFPNGFKIEITATPGAGAIAEAIAGELRKVKIIASVDHKTFGAYRKKQGAGKIQILVGNWSSGGLPDVQSTMGFFFSGSGRDYWRDKKLQELNRKGNSTLDVAKRKAIGKQMFNLINEKNYVLPLTTKPSVFLHTKELVVEKGSIIPFGAEINKMHWK